MINDLEGNAFIGFSIPIDDEQIKSGDKFDDYEIIDKLGKGAFGTVFKVRSKADKKIYALKKANLKLLKEKGKKAYDLTIHETMFLSHISHPHIIKYYKHFVEGDFLYILIEYAENGDIDGFIKAHKVFKKYIPEEELWSIFLQCMKGLAYVHKMGVIHRDIKPANLLMDNNMTIKLGDFGVSAVKIKGNDKAAEYLNADYNFFKNAEFLNYNKTWVGTREYMADEILKNSEYDQKVDVYSMGASFFEMCYLHPFKHIEVVMDEYGDVHQEYVKFVKPEDANVPYSKEMLNIISLMLEENKDKRQTSQYFLELIQTEFSKKFVKNTGIDSIMRCLYSFQDITTYYLNLRNQDLSNKPVTKAYIDCLISFTKKQKDDWFNSIKDFREIICTENTELEKSKEIDPRIFLNFLLMQLHNEIKETIIEKNEQNKYYMISGEEEARTSEINMMLSFLNKFLPELGSYISRQYFGLIKLTKDCQECKIRTFSFNSFFFITFDLEKYAKEETFFNIDIPTIFSKFNSNEKIIENYCIKCLKSTKHNFKEEFYSVPDYLIISIKRGTADKLKIPLILSETLDLRNLVQSNGKKFTLVGFISKEDENFISKINFRNLWYKNDWRTISQIKNQEIFDDTKGKVIMLFYKAIGK